MSVAASKLELRRTSSLKPYAGNARRHSKRQVKQTAKSIQRWGFTNPVLVSDDDEIIAGHGRVMAAKEIGMQEIPTSDCLISLLPSDAHTSSLTISSQRTQAGTPKCLRSNCGDSSTSILMLS